MVEKMTRITIPGAKHATGYQDYGEQTYAKMVDAYRAYAQYMLDQANEILNTPLDGFKVDIVRGSIVQHHIREVKP